MANTSRRLPDDEASTEQTMVSGLKSSAGRPDTRSNAGGRIEPMKFEFENEGALTTELVRLDKQT